MLSSRLIIALCDTDEEVSKFVHFNSKKSVVTYMKDFCLGYTHVCGTPKSDGVYLMVDCALNGITPDLLFEHIHKTHGRTITARFYGYLMEDVLTAGMMRNRE